MGESAMTQEVVWGVDKIELEKSILSVILQKKSKSRVGKSKSEFPKVPTYRSVTKFTLGTNIPYCTFFKFYIIVWRRLYHFYHECREEDEPWMTHPFCLDDDFFFQNQILFFSSSFWLLFGKKSLFLTFIALWEMRFVTRSHQLSQKKLFLVLKSSIEPL